MGIHGNVRQKGVARYSKHELYSTWYNMNFRCFVEKSPSYKIYGQLGIGVCDKWVWSNLNGFLNFITDMPHRPKNHTVDRINPYGSYNPSNCRWATRKTQQNNLRKERDTLSGLHGVVPYGEGRWAAQIGFASFGGAPFIINVFDSVDKAYAAREQVIGWLKEMPEDEVIARVKNGISKLDNNKRPYNKKTSKYYGVSWNREKSCWRSALSRKNSEGIVKSIHIGYYKDEFAAHRAVLNYMEKIGELHGRQLPEEMRDT